MQCALLPQVHALGRKEYGRLGVGEGGEDCLVPTQVPGLAAARCLEVAAGTAVSYAVTEDGDCLAWGMGTNGQLGTGEEVSIALHCQLSALTSNAIDTFFCRRRMCTSL